MTSRLDQDVQSQETSPTSGLRTTGLELKNLLEKTGRTVRDVNGLDKLDLLNLMVEQIKEQIECRGRMSLRITDLNTLLKREGLPSEETAQEAIMRLLELRARQLARLGTYSLMPWQSMNEADNAFSQALMIIPSSEVDDCFAFDERDQARSPPTPPGPPHTPPISPLKSSGQDLMQLLEKAGKSLRGLGILEKPELLDLIIEQVQEKIVLKQRMALTLSELQAVLVCEGVDPGVDARTAVQQLNELRRSQLVRLGHYVRPRSTADSGQIINAGDDFAFTLMQMPLEDLKACFAAEALKSPERPVTVGRPLTRSDAKPVQYASMERNAFAEEAQADQVFSSPHTDFNSRTPGSQTPEFNQFSYADLEAKVTELNSRLGQAETRASLAEEKAKVASLQASLDKAEARARAAEQRADGLESRLALLEGRGGSLPGGVRISPVKTSSPTQATRPSSVSKGRFSKPEVPTQAPRPQSTVKPDAGLTRQNTNSVEVPAGRNRSPGRSAPTKPVPAPVEAFSPKVRTKAPLPEAATGKCSPIVRKGNGPTAGRPLFVNF